MPSKKVALVVLAAFTVLMMVVFFTVPSAIGEGLGEALQSAAEFTGTEDDVQEMLDRVTHETRQDANPS